MLTTFLKNAIVVFFAFVFVACGKTTRRNDAPTHEEQEKLGWTLAGVRDTEYRSACFAAEKRTGSSQETIRFAVTSFEMEWVYFDGVTCEADKKRKSYIYKYRSIEKENISKLEGWETYVYVVDGVFAAPMTVMQKKIYQEDEAYGIRDWKLGNYEDVSGLQYNKKSEAKFAKGKVRNSTVRLEADALYMARYIHNVPQKDKPFIYEKID